MSNASNLRPTRAEDLPGISDLTEIVFGRRRSPALLGWLLLPDEPDLGVESRVVEKDGRIVGHVGRIKSEYHWLGAVATAGHPILWMLAPDCRGTIAVRQGRWSTRYGDFSLVIGGTPKSRPIMKLRRFVEAGVAVEHRLATAGVEPDGRIALEAWRPDEQQPPGPPFEPGAPVVNLASTARLRWLAACPELDGRLLRVRLDRRDLGCALLYVNREFARPTGRIVHMPWTAHGHRSLLRALVAELAAAGCASASILTTSTEQDEAAADLGGEPFYERPIFYRNQGALPGPPRWHLSYLEGDLAYRGV